MDDENKGLQIVLTNVRLLEHALNDGTQLDLDDVQQHLHEAQDMGADVNHALKLLDWAFTSQQLHAKSVTAVERQHPNLQELRDLVKLVGDFQRECTENVFILNDLSRELYQRLRSVEQVTRMLQGVQKLDRQLLNEEILGEVIEKAELENIDEDEEDLKTAKSLMRLVKVRNELRVVLGMRPIDLVRLKRAIQDARLVYHQTGLEIGDILEEAMSTHKKVEEIAEDIWNIVRSVGDVFDEEELTSKIRLAEEVGVDVSLASELLNQLRERDRALAGLSIAMENPMPLERLRNALDRAKDCRRLGDDARKQLIDGEEIYRRHFEVVDFVHSIPTLDISLIHENLVNHLINISKELELDAATEELEMLLQVIESRKNAIKRLKAAIDGCPEGVEELSLALQHARHIEFRTGALFPGDIVSSAASLHEDLVEMKHVVEKSVEMDLNVVTKSHLDTVIERSSQLGLEVNDALKMVNVVKFHETAEDELKSAIETIPRSPVCIRNALLKCKFVNEEMKSDLETLMEHAANILKEIEEFSLRFAEGMVLDVESQEEKSIEDLVHKGRELGVDISHAEDLLKMLRDRKDVLRRLTTLMNSNLIGFSKLENLLQEADGIEKETCALLGEEVVEARAVFAQMEHAVMVLENGIEYLDVDMLDRGISEAEELRMDVKELYEAKRLALDVSLLSRRLETIEKALSFKDIDMLCSGLEEYYVVAPKVPRDHSARIDVVFQDAVLNLRQNRDTTRIHLVRRLMAIGGKLELSLLDLSNLEKSLEERDRRKVFGLVVPAVGLILAVGYLWSL